MKFAIRNPNVCAALAAALWLPAAASAATYHVATTGSDDNAGTAAAPFATLAKAVGVAADGDTIRLSAETHTVTAALSLAAGVQILGATDDPADTTVRRAANGYNIFSSIASVDALVAGISFAVPSIQENVSAIGTFTAGTISNCVFTGFCSKGYGGAISEMKGAANDSCVVADCTFTGCYSGNGVIISGGAIRITSNGYGTIRGCRFIDNNSRGGGGAIASNSTRPLIVDCLFSGNWSGHGQMNNRTSPGSGGWGGAGGAVSCDQSAGMTVSNCVFASNKVVLPIGTGTALTISGNGSRSGGAAYGCNLYRCVVTNNAATVGGGGLYGGKAYDCLIAGNTAGSGNGGGTLGTALYGCTVAGNTTGGNGGGSYGGSAVNSIVYGNTAASDDNWSGTTFSYSCTTPAASGTGNISSAPAFKDDWTLKAGSPCIDAGDDSSAVQGEDLAGAARIQGTAVDMGCYERDPSLVEFAVAAVVTGETFGYDSLATSFSATVSGNTTGEDPSYAWDMGDGTTYSGTDKAAVSHTYSAPGVYTVTCTATAGAEIDTATLAGAVTVGTSGPVYVNAAGSGTIPYDTAEKGATTIAAALALLKEGGIVYVTNGSYNLSATVTISGGTKLVGCGTTVGDVVIKAAQYVRPFVLEGSGSVISGIRIQDTTAPNTSVASDYPHAGAAILVRGGTVTNCVFYNCKTSTESSSIKDTDNLQIENCGAVMLIGDATVADCFFTNCFSQAGSGVNGGGAIQVNRGHGVIRGCDFYGNTARASGGAIHVPTARGATAEIWNCTFRNNQGSGFNGYGGAVSGGGAGTVLYNCLVEGNYTTSRSTDDRCSGGGVYNATLVNCTVVGNYIKQTAGSAGHFGAGVYKCAVTNSIVWANSNTVDSVLCNWSESDAVTSFGYSCTSPLADGTRNTDADPVFAAGWHLSTGSGAKSPLLGKGLAMDWMSAAADLAGLPRLTGRKVSPGCYEDPYSAGFFFYIR